MSSDLDDESNIVKMRGLPWSATVEEIFKFFDGCNIRGGKSGVQMTMSREGRPSGEAYVELETEEDVQKALKKDRDHMGPRYIEVFRAKRSEMEWVLRRSGMTFDNAIDEGCVRLRGLPFGCTKDEISDFFKGLEIVSSDGIILPTDYTGRSTGEAYVEFVNKDMAEKALQKHKEKIGHRYIEIFRSSRAEVRSMSLRSRPMGGGAGGGGGGSGFNQRPAPYDRGDRFGGLNRYNSNNNMGPLSRPSRNFKSSYSGGFGDFDDGPWEPSPWSNSRDIRDLRDLRGNGPSRAGNMMSSRSNQNNFNDNGGGGPWNDGPMHVIHMRGLPFRANQADIADFFRPINPVNIRLLCDDNGRPSGEADVEFISHEDAVRAMSKDKSNMQHRYIELFLNSAGGVGGGGGGGGGSGGFGNNSYNGGAGYRGGGGGGGGGRWGADSGRGYM